jgi:hypothetical protein
MSASCCGGEFDLFLQKYRHRPGCSQNQVGSANRRHAEKEMAAGANDAFGPSRSTSTSYRLGKEQEEKRRIDRQVPIIGGRRRRGRLLP